MKHPTNASFLEDQLGVLVKHFGIGRLRRAIARIPDGADGENSASAKRKPNRSRKPSRQNGVRFVESIRETDPEKYRLLDEFLLRLRDMRILPEAQDIRQFAGNIGIKEFGGKSREEMIPKLIRLLSERPTRRLRDDIAGAENISEHQRQRGFSVLADKLLGKP
jgi:hypothetical protein